MLVRLLLMFVLAAWPASAAEWRAYANARFGYAIELPADFITANEAVNGDGILLRSQDGRAELRVFGANILDHDFATEVDSRRAIDANEGWWISYDKSAPAWASYSGTRGNRILYVRAVALCDSAAGYFSLTYLKAERKRYDLIVSHLVKTLSAPAHC
ncbi:hypothetical protein ACVITL_001143 [Rhizobium pisi]